MSRGLGNRYYGKLPKHHPLRRSWARSVKAARKKYPRSKRVGR